MSARSPSPSSTDQLLMLPLAAVSIICPIATRRRVVSSSRGSQTKAKSGRRAGCGPSTRVGRGRSASDMAVRTSSSIASRPRLTQVARQRGDRVAERLAAVAARIEAEVALELLELAAEDGDVLDRRGQRLAGPQAGMDADAATLPFSRIGTTTRSSGTRRWMVERRSALATSGARHAARASASRRARRRGRSARRAGGTGRARRSARGRAIRHDSRAGSSRRRRTSAARRRLRDRRSRRRRRASCACISRQSVTAARTSARTRWSSEAISRRSRPPARSTSTYIIDLRRSASSHSGSTAVRRLLVAHDADDRVEQAVDDEPARGERVGDGIDEERHVVVDDPDPHAAMAGCAAERFDASASAARRRAAQAATNSAAASRPR